MHLKAIDDRSPRIMPLFGHSGGFAEWDEPIHETLPGDDVPSKTLLGISGPAGRGIHPTDAEPAAFRRSDTIREKPGSRIVERRADGSTRFHERESGADAFRRAVRRVRVSDRLHRAAQGERSDSGRLHPAVVRQREHATDPIGFLKIVIRVFRKPIETGAPPPAVHGDAAETRHGGA